MKKTRLWKTMVTLAMSATMLLSATVAFAKTQQAASNVPTPENAEVTDDYRLVAFEVENAVGTANPLTDEDLQVVAEAWGASSIGNDGTDIVPKDAVFSVDWEKSSLQMEDIWGSYVEAYWFKRNESDKLVLEASGSFGGIDCGKDADGNRWQDSWNWWPWNFFIPDSTMSLQYTLPLVYEDWNGLMPIKDRLPDLITVKAYYNPEFDMDGYIDWASWTGSYFIVDKEDFVFHFKEDTVTDDTNTDDTTTENYVLDLSDGNAVLSGEDFASLLEENKTKDVVIQSNNGVTFTFKKGTMQAVEGKDSYDFSTTLNSDYSKVTNLPSHVTADNFIEKIDYNYSGQLPAEASIRFYVGIEYAGKTLYYSQLLGNSSISLVQSVTVDAEGYITVTQDHCSSYIITKENVEMQTTTGNNQQQASNAKTGDAGMFFPCILLCASVLGLGVSVRKYKRA